MPYTNTPSFKTEEKIATKPFAELIKDMEADAEEYGQLHDESCPCNMEYPDACDCDNMKSIKAFGKEWMEKVNRRWEILIQEHRKYCNPDGNKHLTRILGKKNRALKSDISSRMEWLEGQVNDYTVDLCENSREFKNHILSLINQVKGKK